MTTASNSQVLRTIPLLIAFCLVGMPSYAQYGGGMGEPNDPYLVYTAEQMNTIGAEPNDWDMHFKLMADIDLAAYTGTDFNIIGIGWDNPFTGVFDGNGRTISNFSYTSTDRDDVGLFGYVRGKNAQIKDLGLIDPNVDAGTGDWVGSLVGFMEIGGTIDNCYAERVSVAGHDRVGGLVGFNSGTITNCSSTGNILGENYVGGLLGLHSIWPGEGRITDCYSTSSVTGTTNVGGLVGSNEGTIWPGAEESIIADCYVTGSVTGTTNVGGLMGSNEGTITNCYSTGSVAGDVDVGGLVGRNGRAFYDSAWYSWTFIDGTISKCYSTSSISGNEDVGGLVGLNDVGTVSNCYATCSASGDQFVGGLVGYNWDRISNCYSVGSVIGTNDVGGLVGLYLDGQVTFSFWNTETSGLSTSTGGTGKTTAEMQTASTFLEAGWDFVDETANGTDDIWWILEGQDYPRLWWQYGQAFSLYPQDGAVNVPQPLILSWLSVGLGLYHDVYFGEDKEAVANATIESSNIYRGRQEPEMTTYNPGSLELVKTYYWRIDEVNQADPNSPWKGDVWCFTTANFIVVDDFEDYDSNMNFIWHSWFDGLEPGIGLLPGNGTGSVVGDDTTASFTEETIVHGGKQSMPLYYNNNKIGFAKYSETNKYLIYPRDWTKESASELSLWFHGRSDFVGSFVEEPIGVFTINSSGTDIGGERDQFHFAYKKLTGPGSILARIDSIENTHEWAKAGLMIRDSLIENSKNAFVYVTPSNGIAFQTRTGWRQTSVATN